MPAENMLERNARESKYKSIRTDVNGEKFDSKREAKRWRDLNLMQRAGEISELVRQRPYVLAPRAQFHNSRPSPELRYFADFVYTTKSGQCVVEDVKSEITRKLAAYRIKRHLMKTVHGIEIREVT